MFWALFAMDFCSIFPLFLLSSIWKTVGLQVGGIDDYTLTLIGSMGSIANGLSRMFWGPVQDKTGFLFVYRTVLALELIVCLSLYWSVTVSPFVYMIVIFFGFVCLGAHFVMFPGIILKVFGMRAGGQLYSILYTAYALASILGLVVYKATTYYLGNAGNQTVFNISIGLIFVSFGILTAVFEEKPITKETGTEMGLIAQEE